MQWGCLAIVAIVLNYDLIISGFFFENQTIKNHRPYERWTEK